MKIFLIIRFTIRTNLPALSLSPPINKGGNGKNSWSGLPLSPFRCMGEHPHFDQRCASGVGAEEGGFGKGDSKDDGEKGWEGD